MIPNRVTLHCSATRNGEIYPIDQLRKFHTDPVPLGRGWKDIGYHMVFQPDGSVDQGRSLNVQGAGVEGENEGNIHFCLVGTDRFTKGQFESLRYKLDSVLLIYPIPHWEIHCHYLFQSAIHQGKTCPNISIQRLLCWYLLHEEKAVQHFLLNPID